MEPKLEPLVSIVENYYEKYQLFFMIFKFPFMFISNFEKDRRCFNSYVKVLFFILRIFM